MAARAYSWVAICMFTCFMLTTGHSYKGNRLLSVPAFDADTCTDTELDLSYNDIAVIPENAFPKSVVRLNMAHNEIKMTSIGAFQMSAAIIKLDLSHNLLTCMPNLSPLHNSLAELNLRHNKLTGDCSALNALRTFIQLKLVDLRNNPLAKLPALFQNSPALEQLYIDDDCVLCSNRKANPIFKPENGTVSECSTDARQFPVGCRKFYRQFGLTAHVVRLKPNFHKKFTRKTWAVTWDETDEADENQNVTGRLLKPPQRSKLMHMRSEIAFIMICATIFLCTGGIASILYLGHKNRKPEKQNEKLEADYITEFSAPYYTPNVNVPNEHGKPVLSNPTDAAESKENYYDVYRGYVY